MMRVGSCGGMRGRSGVGGGCVGFEGCEEAELRDSRGWADMGMGAAVG